MCTRSRTSPDAGSDTGMTWVHGLLDQFEKEVCMYQLNGDDRDDMAMLQEGALAVDGGTCTCTAVPFLVNGATFMLNRSYLFFSNVNSY